MENIVAQGLMRYFYTENASYPIRIADEKFRWEVVGKVAGTVKGVMALEGERLDRFLEFAVPRYAMEIEQEEYEECLKKKNSTVPYSPLPVSSRGYLKLSPETSPNAAVESSPPIPAGVSAHLDPVASVVAKKQGVVRESPALPKEEEQLPAADDALDLGVIQDDEVTAKRPAKQPPPRRRNRQT
ncbi:MAG TPA: hypothetical protein VMW69_02580 [Spirochaetia bacterium]|nr:hypothetical protein [Spirochaetia bacterium]